MTINNKVSIFLRVFSVLLCVAISATAQTRTEYFRTYDDFLRQRSTPLTELHQPPFVRVISQGNRPAELFMIDSSGIMTEKRIFSYDDNGDMIAVATYNGKERLTMTINYQPDSIQTRMIAKIQGTNWMPNNEACYTETHFDSLGKPVEERIYAFSGYLIGVITLDYNESGHLVRESYYKGEGAQLIEYTEFAFILPDSVQTVKQYDGDGKLKSAVSLRIYK